MISRIKKLIPFNIAKKIRGIWQRFMAIYYYGHKYECPFCENTFRKLLPGGINLSVIKEKQIIGAGRRANCICPRCYSTDRDRLIYLYLKDISPIFEQSLNVIHIAPSGSLKALMTSIKNINYQSGVKYYEGFYYSEDVALMDITKLSFNDQSFDVIFCNHVLEHIEDDKKAMSELYRILKSGGWGILQVPISNILDKTYEDHTITDPKEKEIHFGQFDHVRIYGKDYTERLKNVGFKVNIIDPKITWKNNNIDKYAINKNEVLFIVSKG